MCVTNAVTKHSDLAQNGMTFQFISAKQMDWKKMKRFIHIQLNDHSSIADVSV